MGAFVKAAASSAIWFYIALGIRSIFLHLGITKLVPEGIIFSLPLVIQYASSSVSLLGLVFCGAVDDSTGKNTNENYFSFLMKQFPILPVRVAEFVQGKLTKKGMLEIVFAQAIGYSLGLVFFLFSFGWIFDSPDDLLFSIQAKQGNNIQYLSDDDLNQVNNFNFSCCEMEYTVDELNAYAQITQRWQSMDVILDIFMESIISCLYCVIVLIGHEIFLVNRASIYWMSFVLLILILLHSCFLHSNSQSSALNPFAALVLYLFNSKSLSGEEFENIAKACGPLNSVEGILQIAVEKYSSFVKADITKHYNLFQFWNLIPFSIHLRNAISGLFLLFKGFEVYIIRSTLFLEHFTGPILGGIMAGFICSKFAPDEPNSWKRVKH